MTATQSLKNLIERRATWTRANYREALRLGSVILNKPGNYTNNQRVLVNKALNIIRNRRRVKRAHLKAEQAATRAPSNNTSFERFTNHLVNVTKNNKNIILNISGHNKNYRRTVELGYGTKGNNRNYSFVRFVPVKNKKGVYLEYGRTGNNRRMWGEGTRLRNYGARAARDAGVPLYQYGENIEKLLPKGSIPISTRIMRNKLGAVPTRSIPGIGKVKYGSMVRAHPYATRTVRRS